MDKFNTTLESYRKFVEIKFKPEAASELRKYLNNLNDKISAEGLANTRFMKMLEAFTVFFAKTVSLKNNHKTVEIEDLHKALSFIEFYSTERLWSELAEGKTFRNFKTVEWNFLEELKKCFSLEISFNAKKAFEEIIKRFTIHAAQIFSESEKSVQEKFMLLIRYTIIILSLLLSLSKRDERLNPETVLKSYELFRIVCFRLPAFEFDVLFSVKNFIRKEIIIRLLEYMEKAAQSDLVEKIVERVLNDVGLTGLIEDKPIFYSEVKSLIQIIYLFIQYSRKTAKVEENDYRMVLNIYKSILNTVFEEDYSQTYRSFYKELSNLDLSIDARIFVNNIGSIIIGFSRELSLPPSILNLLSEISRKITLALSAVSKMLSFKNKKLESDVEDLKKSINIISNVFFNIKRS
ncbi:MAG: hypothetical protein OdinLCB4_001545 [Candidatus Odinarchaeum yellowstonii]|uniref:Uncharacterized protein n=1 Tax=Odinarchaeota yellowstonii (strain LCB_4) TaxID=1841599 RepID=A0AAF0D2T3_ODILC|nr:MAG: hypothetical protein OdinLCB4_001545 [Candidatus Odinarchaeum yellowstonii]